MNPNKLFPLVITDKIAETREYYVKVLGAEVAIEQDGYLQMRFGGDPAAPEIAFMPPAKESPIGELRGFGGEGLLVSIPQENADHAHKAMKKRGAEIVTEPSDKPWGWRSFIARDPSGVRLDFFHVLDQSAVADATG